MLYANRLLSVTYPCRSLDATLLTPFMLLTSLGVSIVKQASGTPLSRSWSPAQFDLPAACQPGMILQPL
jgi:hypothetical protein